MSNEKLISSSVSWKKHSKNGWYYFIENDKVILLRMNNFPDEPLYSLVNGLDIIDLEDKPSGWTLEKL